jgi:anthranilate synthase component 1
MLARFDTLVVFDHVRQRVDIISNEIEGEVDRDEALARLDEITRLLTTAGQGGAVQLPQNGEPQPMAATPSLDGPSFRAAVRHAKELIADGEVFQVVVARRWALEERADPLSLYRALRMVNPSPYMVLLETPEVSLVGASPEMLVRKTGPRVETRPIAGTRPRSADPEEDRRLAEDLLVDAKECAEHVMLVDLGRNDLGRVATAGSVRVNSFMDVERYSHVMHIVSNVEGEIAAGKVALDALLACFPAGTVSGGRSPATRWRWMLCWRVFRPGPSPARQKCAPWRSSTNWSPRPVGPMRVPSAISPSPATSTPASRSERW